MQGFILFLFESYGILIISCYLISLISDSCMTFKIILCQSVEFCYLYDSAIFLFNLFNIL